MYVGGDIVNNFHSFVSSQISCICIEYFKVFHKNDSKKELLKKYGIKFVITVCTSNIEGRDSI